MCTRFNQKDHHIHTIFQHKCETDTISSLEQNFSLHHLSKNTTYSPDINCEEGKEGRRGEGRAKEVLVQVNLKYKMYKAKQMLDGQAFKAESNPQSPAYQAGALTTNMYKPPRQLSSLGTNPGNAMQLINRQTHNSAYRKQLGS